MATQIGFELWRHRADDLAVWQTGRLMPREGLRIELERLDFVKARQYAQKVLQTDPDYTSANFAMGMSFLLRFIMSLRSKKQK